MNLKIGDKVIVKKNRECEFCKGKTLTIIKIQDNKYLGSYPITCSNNEIFKATSLIKVGKESDQAIYQAIYQAILELS